MCFTEYSDAVVKEGYAWKVFARNKQTGEFFHLLKDRHTPRVEGKWYKSEMMQVWGVGFVYPSAFSLFVSKKEAIQIADHYARRWYKGYNTVVVVRVQYKDADLEGNVTWGYGRGTGINTRTRQAKWMRIVPNSIVTEFGKDHYFSVNADDDF